MKSAIMMAIEKVSQKLEFNPQQSKLENSNHTPEVRDKVCAELEDVITELKMLRDTIEREQLQTAFIVGFNDGLDTSNPLSKTKALFRNEVHYYNQTFNN